jgi:hypothetical protein
MFGALFTLYRRQQMAASNRAERVGSAWLAGLADVGRQLVQRALRSFRAGSSGLVETRAGAGLARMATIQVSVLLAQALAEDSNLKLDWLWYAGQLEDAGERHYCLQRALQINPQSELARRELARRQ